MNENEPVEVLKYVSKIQDLQNLADFMDDEHFTQALDRVLKVMSKPEVPNGKIGPMIVEFTGWGNTFKMAGQTYMTINKDKAGTENNYKKNLYFSMSEECHKMAAALKYMARLYE